MERHKQMDLEKTKQYQDEQKKMFNEYMANAKKGDGFLGTNSAYYKHKIALETTKQSLARSEDDLKESIKAIINEESDKKKSGGIYDANNNSIEKKLAVASMKAKIAQKADEMADSTYATTYLNMINGQMTDGENIFDENGNLVNIVENSAGISGSNGESKLFADMINNRKDGIAKHRKNATAILEYNEVDFDDMWNIALGQQTNGNYDFDVNNEFIREAAIEKSIKTGVIGYKDNQGNEIDGIAKLIKGSADPNNEFLHKKAAYIGELTLANGLKGNAFYYGKKAINKIATGQATEQYIAKNALELMNDISKQQIAVQDKDATDKLYEIITKTVQDMNLSNEQFEDLYGMNKRKAKENIRIYQNTIIEAENDERITTISDKAKKKLDKIVNIQL